MTREPLPPLNRQDRRHNKGSAFPDDWTWPKVAGFLIWHPRTLAFVALIAVGFEMAWCHGLIKGFVAGAGVESNAQASSVPRRP